MARTFQIFLALCLFRGGRCGCEYENTVLTCTETNQDTLSHEILKLKKPLDQFSEINIERSSFSVCDDLTFLDGSAFRRVRIGNSFIGKIEDGFFASLRNLQGLALDNNHICDVAFLRGLTSDLSNLRLSNNNLKTVELLTNVKHLENLSVLDLSQNRIESVNGSYFRQLTELLLAHNRITDISKIITGTMENLQVLNLSYNNLKYVKEDNLKLLGSLNILKMEGCRIVTVSYSCFSSLSSLKTVDLQNNDFKPTINISFYSLDTLDLSGNGLNKVSINIANAWYTYDLKLSKNNISEVSLNQVTNLDVSFNNFNGILKKGNFKLPGALISLNMSYSGVKKIETGAFDAMTRLKTLDLSNNNITILDNTFTETPNLLYLNLSFNNITEIRNNTFAGLTKLYFLNISHCYIRRIRSNAFRPFYSIQTVDLSGNLFHQLSPFLFEGLPQLKRVYMRNMAVKFLGNSTFPNLPNLQDVQMQGGQVSVVGYKTFSELSSLGQLDLSSLGIKVVKSVAFYKCPVMQVIDLRRNKISHLESKTFFGLEGLTELHLSGNFIKFIEAGAFSTLINIQYIDISYDGAILKSTFRNLEGLKVLNITYSEISVENAAFSAMPSLEDLHISNTTMANNTAVSKMNGCVNVIPTLKKGFLFGLKSLDTLNLTKSCLKTIEGGAFLESSALNYLDLSYNKLVTIKPYVFEGLYTLTHLNLAYNLITFLHNKSFEGLIALQELNLASNNLSFLPSELFRPTFSMRKLNLNHNNVNLFSSEVFVNLTSLIYLDISSNNITKIKEVTLFPLKNLETLIVADNKIATINYTLMADYFAKLTYIDVTKNRWNCNTLKGMLLMFRKLHISYTSEDPPGSGVDGVTCVDECLYFYCEPGNF